MALRPAPEARPPTQGARPPAQGARPPAQGARPPAHGARPPAQGARPPAQGGYCHDPTSTSGHGGSTPAGQCFGQTIARANPWIWFFLAVMSDAASDRR